MIFRVAFACATNSYPLINGEIAEANYTYFLLDKTEYAWRKAVEWSDRTEEFVKRAGFVLMAQLSVHDKKASDSHFTKFLPIIKR